LVALFKPIISAFSRVAIAWPAASSLAKLMRRPDDNFSMAPSSAFEELDTAIDAKDAA
jgi:hypothetical protein